MVSRGCDPQPQSSSLTLPCQILVSVDGCRSLTAYSGCAHWARASSRRPLPHTAPIGRGAARGKASWPGFYRRGTMGATARGSGTAPCCLYSIDRHSATGLMARAPKSAGRGPSKIAPQGGKPDRHLLRRKQNPCKGCVCPTPTVGNHKPSFVEAAKQSSCRNHVTPQGVSLPHADCGEAERR